MREIKFSTVSLVVQDLAVHTQNYVGKYARQKTGWQAVRAGKQAQWSTGSYNS